MLKEFPSQVKHCSLCLPGAKKIGNQPASIRLQNKSHAHNHSLLTIWFLQTWFTCCSYQSQIKWFIAVTQKHIKPLKPVVTCQVMRLSILHEIQVSEQSSGSRSLRATFEQYREASAPQHMDLPQVQAMTMEHDFQGTEYYHESHLAL